jgi:Fic family protein
LSKHDIEVILAQCKHQNANEPYQVAGFTWAYHEAKLLALNNDIFTETWILDWAALIEPNKNKNGYRKIPVQIRWKMATPATLIPQAMKQWLEWVTAYLLEPCADDLCDEIYRQFEEIHPFADGNGRLGHLIWAIASYNLKGAWPTVLPPDFWN